MKDHWGTIKCVDPIEAQQTFSVVLYFFELMKCRFVHPGCHKMGGFASDPHFLPKYTEVSGETFGIKDTKISCKDYNFDWVSFTNNNELPSIHEDEKNKEQFTRRSLESIPSKALIQKVAEEFDIQGSELKGKTKKELIDKFLVSQSKWAN